MLQAGLTNMFFVVTACCLMMLATAKVCSCSFNLIVRKWQQKKKRIGKFQSKRIIWCCQMASSIGNFVTITVWDLEADFGTRHSWVNSQHNMNNTPKNNGVLIFCLDSAQHATDFWDAQLWNGFKVHKPYRSSSTNISQLLPQVTKHCTFDVMSSSYWKLQAAFR